MIFELKRMLKMKNNNGVALEFLFWLILGVVVLVVMLFVIMILNGKATSAISYIKDIFKWG